MKTKVKILTFQVTPGGYQLTCRFDRAYTPPLAPGGLYAKPNAEIEAYAVHRIVSDKGLQITFETFTQEPVDLPRAGEIFYFRGWWTPGMLAAAQDIQADWQHSVYPADGSHDHCLFTWETISANSDHKDGWFSAKHAWVAMNQSSSSPFEPIVLQSSPSSAK